jgi:hypothetical protein
VTFRLKSSHFSIELSPGSSYLGRGPECRVHLEHGIVSRRHARIDVGVDGVVTIEDLGSVNGTYVNGVLVTSATRLRPGDRILIGSEDVLFTADEGQTPAPELARPATLPSPAGQAPASGSGRRSSGELATLIADPEQAEVKRHAMGPFLVELVEKALVLQRFDEAARLVGALGSSLKGLDLTNPEALQGIVSFTSLAARLAGASRQWAHIDRVFELAAARRWPLPDAFFRSLEELRRTVQPHIGPGTAAYLELLERGARKGTRGLASQLARLRAVLGPDPG